MNIQTLRLNLIALRISQLQACLDDKLFQLEQELGVTVLPSVMNESVRRATRIKIANLLHSPAENHPWLTYWLIVVVAEQVGVGLIGFKGFPDLQGEVEIGYGMEPEHQNKGYTTEALQALIAWAFAQPGGPELITAETLKTNRASHRVLQKAGLTVHEELENSLFWQVAKTVDS